MIPSAEEIMQEHLDPHDCLRPSKCYDMVLSAMIEFAKLHVKEALKSASEVATTDYEPHWSGEQEGSTYINRESITTAYPPENIK